MGLLDPWQKLTSGEARRVSSSGKFDFFWIVLEAGKPGLMLRLGAIPDPTPRLPKLKCLSVSFRSVDSGWAFVLGLNEREQIEIFEILCRDVIVAGEAGRDIDDALSRALLRTRRWYHLLRGGRPKGLTVEEQRGLVGELLFLRELASCIGSATAIEAWTGPLGSAKDFELIGTCVEIKTRRMAAKPFVSISSADQLADVEGSRVFLRVTKVASAVLPDGQSLHDHVNMTAELFNEASTAFEAWDEVIYSTGYDPLNDYDDRRWELGTTKLYEVISGFPRITPPLPLGVENVRYSLSLEACTPFQTEENLMQIIQNGLTP